MRTRLAVLACTVIAVATLAGRQSQPSGASQDTTPVFRSGANLIRVDMYATRGGKFVTDLHAGDVELFEDGNKQTIETFEFVQIGGEAAADVPSLDRQDSRARIYVVFVDTFTARLTGTDLRRDLLRFLDRTVQPSDLVGLMTPDMSAFDVVLSRKNRVMSDLANEERWLEGKPTTPDGLQDFQWENCYSTGRVSRRFVEMKSRRDGRNTLSALRELVDRLRDLREERKAVLLVTGGWPFDYESSLTDRVEQRSDAAGRPEATGQVENEGTGRETKSCADDRTALVRLNFKGLVKDLARSANRANVSFYPFNSRPALAIPREIPAQLRNQLRQRESRKQSEAGGQLRELAEITDGSWEPQVHDMDRIATRIVDDTSHYYLIGYQSSNPRNDSKYHQITIKVNRPGVAVRARSGYGGESVRIVKLGTPPARPLVDSRITTAFEHVQRFEPANPMLLRTSTFRLPASSDGGAFWVVGEAGDRSQHWNGQRAEIIVSDANKGEVFSRRVELQGTADVFDLRVPEAGTLPLGNYSVRVRILRPDDAISPLAQDFFRLDLASVSTSLGEPVLWRRGPLVRDSYRRTADPRFRRVERLRLEYPSVASAPPVARVLDRLGQPLQSPVEISSRDGEGGSHTWVVADLALTGLAPGDYAVSMRQGEATQVTAFRVIP